LNSPLELKNIYHSFGGGKNELMVLKGVNLCLQQGKVFALLGASGSGKSTLLNVGGLLERPIKGEVISFGKSIANADAFRRNVVGFIHQFHYLMADLSALENVALSLLIKRQISKSKANAMATKMLSQLGLGKRLDHRPHSLSGGECQRVAVARALGANPAVVLADEPAGSLDEQNSKTVMEYFLALAKQQNTAVLMATHDKQMASQCDATFTISNGVVTKGG